MSEPIEMSLQEFLTRNITLEPKELSIEYNSDTGSIFLRNAIEHYAHVDKEGKIWTWAKNTDSPIWTCLNNDRSWFITIDVCNFNYLIDLNYSLNKYNHFNKQWEIPSRSSYEADLDRGLKILIDKVAQKSENPFFYCSDKDPRDYFHEVPYTAYDCIRNKIVAIDKTTPVQRIHFGSPK